jgi:hypothetical protein
VENGLPRLNAEAVIGRRLWDFISETTTRHFYQLLAKKARASGKVVSVPFRCDEPGQRRFMKMSIQPQPEGALEFRTELEKEEERPRVDLLDPQFPRTDEKISVCAWCKRVKVSDWIEVETAVRELRLFDQPRLPQMIHVMCPHCHKRMMMLLDTLENETPASSETS